VEGVSKLLFLDVFPHLFC